MTPELAIDLFKQVVLFALYVVAPFLTVMLVIGLATSIFQSVTSIQEQTLVFAPKLMALSAVGILLAPWLIRSLSEFTTQAISRIGTMGR